MFFLHQTKSLRNERTVRIAHSYYYQNYNYQIKYVLTIFFFLCRKIKSLKYDYVIIFFLTMCQSMQVFDDIAHATKLFLNLSYFLKNLFFIFNEFLIIILKLFKQFISGEKKIHLTI